MYYNEIIKKYRELNEISQKEMANYLNIKQQQYSRYEKGINLLPITYLKPICEKLNISADTILQIKLK